MHHASTNAASSGGFFLFIAHDGEFYSRTAYLFFDRKHFVSIASALASDETARAQP
jgi:hypothetical protein